MDAPPTRAVRIPVQTSGTRIEPPAGRSPPPPRSNRERENRAGTVRAYRLFLFFGAALFAIYLLFLAVSVASSASRISANPGLYGAFTAIGAGVGIFGWWITVGRAPRAAWTDSRFLIVRERTGRLTRFRLTPELRVRPVHRYPASLLGPESTEAVEVSVARGPRRMYLVGEQFFEGLGVAAAEPGPLLARI